MKFATFTDAGAGLSPILAYLVRSLIVQGLAVHTKLYNGLLSNKLEGLTLASLIVALNFG